MTETQFALTGQPVMMFLDSYWGLAEQLSLEAKKRAYKEATLPAQLKRAQKPEIKLAKVPSLGSCFAVSAKLAHSSNFSIVSRFAGSLRGCCWAFPRLWISLLGCSIAN